MWPSSQCPAVDPAGPPSARTRRRSIGPIIGLSRAIGRAISALLRQNATAVRADESADVSVIGRLMVGKGTPPDRPVGIRCAGEGIAPDRPVGIGKGNGPRQTCGYQVCWEGEWPQKEP